MQRLAGLAASSSPGLRSWRLGSGLGRQQQQQPGPEPRPRPRAAGWIRPARPLSGASAQRPPRRRDVFPGQNHRLYGSQPGAPDPPRSSEPQDEVSVVGIPDPITWFRCRLTSWLIHLLWDLNVNSEEFHRGAKQALVHVSDLLSTGRYHRLVGIVSTEMIDYVEEKCSALTSTQQQELTVTMEDIIFMLPEDVNVVFDDYGRHFCLVVMRFWILTTHSGPEDPEGTRIFKVAPCKDGSPQKKVVTAVYEFRREMTRGAYPEWKVVTIWHWQWKAAGLSDSVS